jgi:peptide/nickel transport system permease protein
MTVTHVPVEKKTPYSQTRAGSVAPGATSFSTLSRVGRYTIVRAVALFVTVAITVYLTIFIANMGGYVDEIIRGFIDQAISGRVMAGWLRGVPTEEKFAIIEQTRQAMAEAQGLNEPFAVRSLRWLGHGLALDWGESEGSLYIRSLGGGGYSGQVRDVIRQRLPRTMLIFGVANLLLFFTTVFLALSLAKRHGGWLDKIVVTLSPLGAAPAWAYGIILQVIFLRVLTNLVSGGTFDGWPSEFSLAYIPIVLKHMFLPSLSIFVSGFFTSLYTWRAYFMLYSSEDHVEMAKAKGLSPRRVERRHILRPGLPAVLTSFALMLVVLWQEVIALEKFFNVAGIGRVFFAALRSFDIAMILGLVVTFAYLLAITVFALDILYAIVDPRVRVGGDGRTAEPASRKRRRLRSHRSRLRLWPRRQTIPVPKPLSEPYSASKSGGDISTGLAGNLRRGLGSLKALVLDLAAYPSAVVGLAIIVALIGASIATVIVVPYKEAIGLWRGEHNVWYQNPKRALPQWVNLFRKEDLPLTMVLDSRSGLSSVAGLSSAAGGSGAAGLSGAAGWTSKTVNVLSEGMTEIVLSFAFDFPYGEFPQDIVLRFDAQYDVKKPLVTLTWLTPDGREIDVGDLTLLPSQTYYLSQDKHLQRRMDGQQPQQALFADPTEDTPVPLKGSYELRATGLMFEENTDLDAEFVLYGQAHGLAGTDHERRDLMVALLWGMPVALSFGLLAAIGTSAFTIVIAGVGAWYGGWVDSLIQRLTEVNLVLPFLPVSIMVYTLYSKSFWAILGVTVLLSIFGSAIKNYRVVFLQIKESPYIEAARAYGADDRRIIFRYLIPRIMPIMIPQLVILVPSYVFLEATLAFLEVSDPILPTWGKLIVEALSNGTHSGDYYLVLEPAALLMVTGLAFAMVGFALERLLEPRLRER